MKSKKTLKGMTLVEIIIAMAVLAIASSVMCTACSFVAKMKLTTNALTKRINYEAPIADTKRDVTITIDGVDYKTAASPNGYTDNTYIPDPDDKNIDGSPKEKKYNTEWVVSDGTNSYSVKGYLYEVNYNSTSTYGSENGIVDVNSTSATDKHNFKFFVIGGVDVS